MEEPTLPRERENNSRSISRVVAASALVGFLAGSLTGGFAYWQVSREVDAIRQSLPAAQRLAVEKTEERGTGKEYVPQSTQEERIIQTVKEVSPAVVSIVLTEDVPVFEQTLRDPFEDFFGGQSPFLIPEVEQKGTEKREIGGGSGFFVSSDGLIVTNKHVVLRDDVDYTVFTKDGTSYPAQVLARDPVQDLAVLQIEGDGFSFVRLGDSETLEIGQTVIAIGNALGEFRNTVSTGVISGLGRTITASDGGEFVETIEDVIQTDAAINRGNSGGPLLNLAGEVIGVNTATVLQAQSIGFAIPVDVAKRDLQQVQELGRIVYPFLGVQYQLVTRQLQEEQNLPVDYGARVLDVVADSGAAEAGLQKEDVLLEFGGEKITQKNSLAKIIQRYNPGDQISLTVLRNGQKLVLQATLGEREE